MHPCHQGLGRVGVCLDSSQHTPAAPEMMLSSFL